MHNRKYVKPDGVKKKNEKSRFEKCEKGSGNGSRVREGIKWGKRALSGEKWLRMMRNVLDEKR